MEGWLEGCSREKKREGTELIERGEERQGDREFDKPRIDGAKIIGIQERLGLVPDVV